MSRVAISISLPINVVMEIDKAAKESGMSRSSVIEAAILNLNTNNNKSDHSYSSLISDQNQTRTRSKPGANYAADFLNFWEAYPRRVGKGDAWKSWQKSTPAIADVLKALAWQSRSQDWTKEGGKYIPNPATYLNQRRWEDEPSKQTNHDQYAWAKNWQSEFSKQTGLK